MPQGAITDADVDFIEVWENCSPITNWIIRLDSRGDDKPEQIQGAKQFHITTQERVITQERILDPKNDPFLNGCFRPIKTPASISVESNPNALSDEDITNVYRASDLAWNEYMPAIDSPATLRRMIVIAEKLVANDQDISMKRYRQVEDRLAEVSPKTRLTQKDRDQFEKLR